MKGRKTLINADFNIPEGLEASRFRLRMLTVHDLIKDFDAVMTSSDHLQESFSVITGSNWPEGLTLEDNLIDLGWHQREFTLHYSFAYTVVTLSEEQCLGCVYIDPSPKPGYDAMVTMWVRASELENGLDAKLYESVKTWISAR
ncbi:uncharacterized protein METZ01_LOCUS121673, partial [marine metagenome]